MLLSILICSLRSRQASLDRLTDKLRRQIEREGAEDAVEVLVNQDGGELLIGTKRNLLMQQASGEYACFVDDDDDVSDDYVKKIIRAVLSERPDCAGIEGRILLRGVWHKFYHSVRYKLYLSNKSARKFYRPPNHLNPIRRDIARRFPFTNKDFGEDSDYAMSIQRAGALKTEVYIEGPIYIYTPRGEGKKTR